MAGIGTQYNPAQVMLGNGLRQPTSGSPIVNGTYSASGANRKPYLPTSQIRYGNGTEPGPQSQAGGQGGSLGPEAVRATGSGPYDSAYRQNLATYAGGQLSRPGGLLSFNPTDPNSFPGNPTGGGNAPVMGSPTGLLDQALGGSPFSYTPPANPTPGASQNPSSNYWKFWLNQFAQPYNNLRYTQASY